MKGSLNMRATIIYGAGDVRIETIPDARVIEPTDALVAVTRACICGSDLWPYKTMERSETGRVMGHEAMGVVEAVGADVRQKRRTGKRLCNFSKKSGDIDHENYRVSRKYARENLGVNKPNS
jgi:threonine dehydrogenase-like Zn-dependent dehydrogenase